MSRISMPTIGCCEPRRCCPIGSGARCDGSRHVLEAEAGAFARWGLRVGDVIEFVDDRTDAPTPPGDADCDAHHTDVP